jgi:hypothetical protein
MLRNLLHGWWSNPDNCQVIMEDRLLQFCCCFKKSGGNTSGTITLSIAVYNYWICNRWQMPQSFPTEIVWKTNKEGRCPTVFVAFVHETSMQHCMSLPTVFATKAGMPYCLWDMSGWSYWAVHGATLEKPKCCQKDSSSTLAKTPLTLSVLHVTFLSVMAPGWNGRNTMVNLVATCICPSHGVAIRTLLSIAMHAQTYDTKREQLSCPLWYCSLYFGFLLAFWWVDQLSTILTE